MVLDEGDEFGERVLSGRRREGLAILGSGRQLAGGLCAGFVSGVFDDWGAVVLGEEGNLALRLGRRAGRVGFFLRLGHS